MEDSAGDELITPLGRNRCAARGGREDENTASRQPLRERTGQSAHEQVAAAEGSPTSRWGGRRQSASRKVEVQRWTELDPGRTLVGQRPWEGQESECPWNPRGCGCRANAVCHNPGLCNRKECENKEAECLLRDTSNSPSSLQLSPRPNLPFQCTLSAGVLGGVAPQRDHSRQAINLLGAGHRAARPQSFSLPQMLSQALDLIQRFLFCGVQNGSAHCLLLKDTKPGGVVQHHF